MISFVEESERMWHKWALGSPSFPSGLLLSCPTQNSEVIFVAEGLEDAGSTATRDWYSSRVVDPSNCMDSIRKPTHEPLGMPCLQTCQLEHRHAQHSTSCALWLAPCMCSSEQWVCEPLQVASKNARKAGLTVWLGEGTYLNISGTTLGKRMGGSQYLVWLYRTKRRHTILRIPSSKEKKKCGETHHKKVWESLRISRRADLWRYLFPEAMK